MARGKNICKGDKVLYNGEEHIVERTEAHKMHLEGGAVVDLTKEGVELCP